MATGNTEAQPDVQALVRRAQAGCAASAEALAAAFAGQLMGYLRQKVASEHDAEDLAQETLLRAMANLHRYKPRRPFAVWLFTIATNLAVSHYRSRRPAADVDGLALADGRAVSPLEQAATAERRENLWALARTLPEGHFTALWLRYAEGMPIADIARVMGKSRLLVRVYLHRARRRLMERSSE